jgi:hypothetical protein
MYAVLMYRLILIIEASTSMHDAAFVITKSPVRIVRHTAIWIDSIPFVICVVCDRDSFQKVVVVKCFGAVRGGEIDIF